MSGKLLKNSVEIVGALQLDEIRGAGIRWLHPEVVLDSACKETAFLAYIDVAGRTYEAGDARLCHCPGSTIAEISYLHVHQRFDGMEEVVAGAFGYGLIKEAERKGFSTSQTSVDRFRRRI